MAAYRKPSEYLLVLLLLSCLPIQSASAQEPAWAHRVRSAVEKAHKEGKTFVHVGDSETCWMTARDLAEAARSSTVIKGTVTALATSVDPTENVVFTWYKIHVDQFLAGTAPDRKGISRVVPHGLLPITNEDVIVRDIGGTIKVDGVTVQQPLRQLDIHKKYLLFVQFVFDDSFPDAKAVIGSLNFGPAGKFSIDESGDLSPWKHSFWGDEIMQSCAGTIGGLSECLKKNP
jgi:hypothetical protein